MKLLKIHLGGRASFPNPRYIWVAAPAFPTPGFLGTPHPRRGGLTPEEGPAAEEDMLLIVYEFDLDGSTVCT